MVRPLAALPLVVLVLSACGTTALFSRGEPLAAESGPDAGAEQQQAAVLGMYLRTMNDLIEGDASLQADVFKTAEEASLVEPTATNRLNYALALATPGHPSANPAEARRVLAELLAGTDTLLPEERILATVHLKETEQRLILDAQARRVQREAAAATTEQNNATAQRLQALTEENRRLRVELDEARGKLDAITNIERSIRERESSADPQ